MAYSGSSIEFNYSTQLSFKRLPWTLMVSSCIRLPSTAPTRSSWSVVCTSGTSASLSVPSWSHASASPMFSNCRLRRRSHLRIGQIRLHLLPSSPHTHSSPFILLFSHSASSKSGSLHCDAVYCYTCSCVVCVCVCVCLWVLQKRLNRLRYFFGYSLG